RRRSSARVGTAETAGGVAAARPVLPRPAGSRSALAPAYTVVGTAPTYDGPAFGPAASPPPSPPQPAASTASAATDVTRFVMCGSCRRDRRVHRAARRPGEAWERSLPPRRAIDPPRRWGSGRRRG